jgi:glycosyltransferase involved in cell wall biosynthesis
MIKEELKVQLAHTQQALSHAHAVIQWMETSKFWRLRLAWLRLRQKLSFSRDHSVHPFDPANLIVPPPPPKDDYVVWQEHNMPRPADLQKMAETVEILLHKPLISVIMPVFNTPEAFLREAIASVLNQIYPYWQLCIADDASTETQVRKVLEEYQAQDDRIQVVFRENNGHISACSNSALDLATGHFVALLDHDDLLTPDALYEVALLINRYPDADMIYSDEDKIDEDNDLKDPFFKPDWCPDTFLSKMYTCHLGVYRRALVTEMGGFRVGFEGSQDYDLVLRLTEKTDNIYHIPKILYHWRIHQQSAASDSQAKPYAYIAAQKALEEALARRQVAARVLDAPGWHHCVRYELPSHPRVTIIIPTRDQAQCLQTCLQSIFQKSTYSNYEVLVIDNGSVEPETFEVFQQWQMKEGDRFRALPLNIPFNYSTLNNYGVQQSNSEYLLFLNNDIEVLTPDWIEAMVEQAQRPSIGAVGALLLYPDGTIQHAGVVAGIGGVAGHSHRYCPSEIPGYINQIQTITNYAAVTAACLMCRREVFMAVSGFEEDLAVAFNDVDFCFKILQKGYRNIYLPHVKLYHFESKSRGLETTLEKQARFTREVMYMKQKWKSLIEHDPCYNPHLSRTREDYSLNVPY